jgi:hypothetical protein
MEAVIYDTGGDLKQHEVCRLRLEDGKVVASNDNRLGKYVLGRWVADYSSGSARKLTAEDGEEFLKALPAAYSGSRLRVGLEE